MADGKLGREKNQVCFGQENDTPSFRFDDLDVADDDRCFEVVDTIETTALEPGEYQYHLRWRKPETGEEGEETSAFTVVSRPERDFAAIDKQGS